MRALARTSPEKQRCLMRMPCGGSKNVSANLSARSNAMTDITALADQELQVADLYALARRDFGTFVELSFPILHPAKKLVHAAYLDVLIGLMEDCAAGREPRVIINLPPGFMKSMFDLDHVRCLQARR